MYSKAIVDAYKCILVVDDAPDIIFRIRHVMEQKGYVVFGAENGEDALLVLNNMSVDHLPCLILCDINMPVINGWDFIEAAGKINKVLNIPIIIHSSEDGLPDWREQLRKPAAMAELVQAVERHCGQAVCEPEGTL